MDEDTIGVLACLQIAAIVTLQLPRVDLYQSTYIPIFGNHKLHNKD